MKTAVAEINGVGAISFSRQHDAPRIEGESHDAHDARTWREKLHYDPKTLEAYIPGIMLKFALDYTAKQIGIQIQGRGKKTWASVFQSGVICPDRMMLGVKKDQVEHITIQCNPKGIRGGQGRVPRRFPIIQEWGGTATFLILNDMIDEYIFRTHLVKAGQFCGLGRYAPRVGGHLGRFGVGQIIWHDEAVEVLPHPKSKAA